MSLTLKTPVINIENITVSYREEIALRDISLQVQPGEFIGIIGPNGAGKTTLLTVINGLGQLTQGKVTVLGQPVTLGNGHALRKKVGYVAQVQIIDSRMPLTVREVVMIGRYGRLGWLKNPGKQDWRIVDQVLEMVGLASLANRPIGHLSGGEQQKTAIARCLAQEPDLFLLDEPTASLDWKAKTDIMELVRFIHDSRKLTTLFVTHDLSALPLTCDRVLLMKDGRVWGEGSPEKLLTNDNLSRLFSLQVSNIKSWRENKEFGPIGRE